MNKQILVANNRDKCRQYIEMKAYFGHVNDKR